MGPGAFASEVGPKKGNQEKSRKISKYFKARECHSLLILLSKFHLKILTFDEIIKFV